jgi:hypothetical protein
MHFQNNLALAFGLAAMVAAVPFRVSLSEAIDGIYIFSSICIGLAAGFGHLGISAVMALFFCFTNVLFWYFDFGQNPIDNRRIAKKTRRAGILISIRGIRSTASLNFSREDTYAFFALRTDPDNAYLPEFLGFSGREIDTGPVISECRAA